MGIHAKTTGTLELESVGSAMENVPPWGYGADQTKQTGAFYLKTSSRAPFCGECCFSCRYFYFPMELFLPIVALLYIITSLKNKAK